MLEKMILARRKVAHAQLRANQLVYFVALARERPPCPRLQWAVRVAASLKEASALCPPMSADLTVTHRMLHWLPCLWRRPALRRQLDTARAILGEGGYSPLADPWHTYQNGAFIAVSEAIAILDS